MVGNKKNNRKGTNSLLKRSMDRELLKILSQNLISRRVNNTKEIKSVSNAIWFVILRLTGFQPPRS